MSENLTRLNHENLGFKSPLQKSVQETNPMFLLNRQYSLAVQYLDDRQSRSLRSKNCIRRTLLRSSLYKIKKKIRECERNLSLKAYEIFIKLLAEPFLSCM